MKNECSIIRDLLPLYTENMVSEDTRIFIREHLEKCPQCRSLCEAEQVPPRDPAPSQVPMARLRNRLKWRRLQTILLTALAVAVLLVSGFAVLDAPEYFSYEPELAFVAENEDGTVTVRLAAGVTDYRCSSVSDPEDPGQTDYTLEAWSSQWDRLFSRRAIQTLTLPLDGEKLGHIYYSSNNGQADTLIYGADSTNSGRISLPRLSLHFYGMLAAGVFCLLAILRAVFRKNPKAAALIDRVALYPVSYLFAHLIVVGWKVSSYSMLRDLGLMMIVSIGLYLVFLLLYNRIRLHLEMKRLEK